MPASKANPDMGQTYINKELYGGGEVLSTEKTEDIRFSEPGSYLAVLGRTYREAGKDRSRVVSDFFLIQYSGDSGNIVKLLNMASTAPPTVSYSVAMDGKPRTMGTFYRLTFPDVLPTDKQGAKNFFIYNRRQFAKQFNALDEETGVIDWNKIQNGACLITTFNLMRREGSNYLNLDMNSFQVLDPSNRIPVENLLQLYKIHDEARRQAQAARTGNIPPAPGLPDEPPF